MMSETRGEHDGSWTDGKEQAACGCRCFRAGHVTYRGGMDTEVDGPRPARRDGTQVGGKWRRQGVAAAAAWGMGMLRTRMNAEGQKEKPEGKRTEPTTRQGAEAG